ncbi:tyrosine-type recombinase/integrase [Neobacillus sp. YX16]|uniref:tyrosine-type recombinase/integrase n=1 Tax=Neobacillus sp. YX16 TaxID=3047874 RepID=UPI0032E4C0E6
MFGGSIGLIHSVDIKNFLNIRIVLFRHPLRHSCYGTHLLNNGALLDVIQSLLGHEKSETTRIYAKLCGSIRHEIFLNGKAMLL